MSEYKDLLLLEKELNFPLALNPLPKLLLFEVLAEDEFVPAAAPLPLKFSLTFLSKYWSATNAKSVDQSILPCSTFTMTKLWKVRASDQG